MKKLLIICSLVVLLIGATVFNAGAVLINGSIGFAGKITPAPDGLGSATSLSFSGFTTTSGPTGNFAAVPGGTAVTVKPLAFNIPPNPTISSWWSFLFSGNTYTLDATTATVVGQGPTFLTLSGTGTANITGGTFDPTPFVYTLSANVAPGGVDVVGGISNFAPTTVPVPPSLLMLSSGLIGLVVIRRKFRG